MMTMCQALWSGPSLIDLFKNEGARTLLHCWWDCKLVQSLWRTVQSFLKKLKRELPNDPTIPFLGIYPKKTIIWKHTPMFIVALLTTARTWKQPSNPLLCCLLAIANPLPPIHCLLDVAHIYNRMLSGHKKEWNNAIWSNMDGPRDCHTEWSKSDTERQISCITYMWNLKKKKDTNELIYKTEIELHIEDKLVVTRGWGEKIRRLGLTYTLLHTK